MLSNRQIADAFDLLADLLRLKDATAYRFEIIAYQRAAEAIRELPRDLQAIAAEGRLQEIDGVGKAIAAKINELLQSGTLRLLEELKAEIPQGLVDVLRVNSVGPKKAMLFYQQLGITSVAELEAAARAGKLRNLPTMGVKSEQKILESIEALARRNTRARADVALHAAERIVRTLQSLPSVLRAEIAGSLRRGRSTIGDIDLLVATYDAAPIMDAFVNHPDVTRILSQGETKSSVELVSGLQCDLRVVPPERFGTALSYFTGSQAHNIRLRELALERGLSLNEWAFTATDGSGREILCATEEEVYAQLDLPYIPPELREDRGEIEAARANALPKLVEIGDIRADLHMHTTWSDGRLSVREMAWQARERGLQYIVITDHSQSLGVANGLSVERLWAQREEIERVQAEFGDSLRIYHGVELEIRADGTLDYPDDVLAALDVVIASLHTALRQDRATITARLLNAINNPHVDIIGHPRGQLIPDREPADLDMDAVFAAALATDTALEINANPHRLDLDSAHAHQALKLGIKLAINTDAHSAADFAVLPFGVRTARRAWASAEQIINTWSRERFEEWIRT
ncbi:MAG: DNA polymerase/3'-5' exonuclease PolX [Anaerolineae bacterium]|nr:DNA polymerase/3'-5' exonuclease PolX [Anaerolineae bacterium]MDW8299083.1 DNA polymerase/3'-5' exonuclease PolX [Anaerolineae bacterium]